MASWEGGGGGWGGGGAWAVGGVIMRWGYIIIIKTYNWHEARHRGCTYGRECAELRRVF
jgi:hypothetical protein